MEVDAFGRALLDRLDGGEFPIVIERDDGLIDADASDYFAPVEHDPLWRWIRPRLGRRVLDLGAGAGRGAVALQDEGVDVTALDVSPGCIEVCARRGIRQTFVGTMQELVSTAPSPFDTILALGNNLGLIGSRERAGDFFHAAGALGTGDLRIVGTMLDPYDTSDPRHLEYHRRNREAGRLGGEVRVRVRYQERVTAWFDLLWASPDELAGVCALHGWTVVATERSGILYAAELRRA